jgi:hypothetical protein
MVDIALTNVEATFIIQALEQRADWLIAQIERAESVDEVSRLEVHLTLAEDLLDVFLTNLEAAQHESPAH